MKKNQHLSKVSRITIARLYNLGNYEHVRYEISIDIPPGGSAKNTLTDLMEILKGLKPIKRSFEYESAMAVTGKPYPELSEAEREHLDEMYEIIGAHNAMLAERRAAVAKLDALGGTAKRMDAKDQWDDSQP